MFYMDIMYELRRRSVVQKQSIFAITQGPNIPRPTALKYPSPTVKKLKCKPVQVRAPPHGVFPPQRTA